MRRTKARRARRVHPPVDAALEVINANARAVRRQSATNTRSSQNTLRSRSREFPLAEDNRPSRVQDGPSNQDDNSRVEIPSSARNHSRTLHHPADRQSQTSARRSQRKTQNCLKRPSPRQPNDPPFSDSQSNVWQQLPIKHRMCSLLLGFLSMYYFMFAKHHHYDKEIVAIHADVEKLLRQANKSILGENLVEAELPDIFKEAATQSPSPAPTEKEKRAPNGSVTHISAGTKSSRNSTSPLKLRKQNKKKGGISRQKSKSQKLNAGKRGSGGALLSPIAPNNATQNQNASKKVGTDSAIAQASDFRESSDRQSLQADSAAAQISQGQGAQKSNTTQRHTNDEKAMTQSVSAQEVNSLPNSSARHASSFSKPEEEYDYSLEFKDLGETDVPKDHVAVLDWNYESVIDPATTEQIFASGNKLHHVAAYKPLCIESATGEAISFAGKRVCSGFNRTSGWMIRYCDVLKNSLLRENLLKIKAEEKPKEWLKEKESSIQWVEGLTVLQIMEKNCGNIAHFSGRILMLQHIVDNIAAYASPPSRVENILILPTFDIMKRFLYPHNYDFWHKSVFSALVAPAKFTIGTLGNFLYREEKIPYAGIPRVQLLHNFSLSRGPAQGKDYVCFRRVVVPGFLKGRFFADDIEYPSKKPSLQSSSVGAPRIPRDSLRFRERISAFFNHSPHFSGMQKEIVFLDRNGARRVMNEEAKSNVVHMFQSVSSEKGYKFKLVSFNNMTFKEQYEAMKGASIAIGIHGANLVNAMFMPPLSVLIELFPFGFMHDMYANGGNSGLKYYKYQMQTGLPFNGPKQFRSVEQCIQLSHDCKVHFRDSVLQVTADDLKAMEKMLRQAIDWCDERPKPFSSTADARHAGSLERRRR